MLSEDPLEIYGIDKMNISEMFDFKYKEDIQKCYSVNTSLRVLLRRICVPGRVQLTIQIRVHPRGAL